MASAAFSFRQWLFSRRWSRALSLLHDRKKKHPFDRAYGVDTGGLLYADALTGKHEQHLQNAGYYATAPSLFHGAIDLWCQTLPATGCTESDYTLIDIGCGKGRVLMLATEYAFREIIGIEIDPRLTRIARKNLHKWTQRALLKRACHPERGRAPRDQVEGPAFLFGAVPQVSGFWKPGKHSPRLRILEGDALSVPLPTTPTALFYFNSFEREMTGKWLAHLAEIAPTRTAPIDLIYIHPEFDAMVRQLPGMQPLAQADIRFSAEDAAADAFNVADDRCAIYRLGT